MENKVLLIGRVGKDPELETRVNKNGNEYKSTYISLATSSSRRDPKTKEPITETQWHRLIFYNEYADYICNKLSVGAGDLISVMGEIVYYNREENGKSFKTASIVVSPNKGGCVKKLINQKKRNMTSNRSYDDSNKIPDDYDNYISDEDTSPDIED